MGALLRAVVGEEFDVASKGCTYPLSQMLQQRLYRLIRGVRPTCRRRNAFGTIDGDIRYAVLLDVLL